MANGPVAVATPFRVGPLRDQRKPNSVTGAPVNFSIATRINQAPARRMMPTMAQVKVCQAAALALGSEPEREIRIPATISMIKAARAIRAGRGSRRFLITQPIP